MSTNSSAGWLVKVFSLLSNATEALPTPEMASPKLVAGFAIQFCTCAVTFTSRYVLTAPLVVDANGAEIVGRVLYVTEFSFHDEVIREKDSVPAVVTVFW